MNTAGQRRSAKRPIDKRIVNVALGGVVAAQQSQTLYAAASFPGTITGLRWDITVTRQAGTTGNLSQYKWAIVVVPEGTTASTLVLTGGSTMYSPEQNVLAFGGGATFSLNTGMDQQVFEGSTKAMRKLRAGDVLAFVALGVATESVGIYGAVQFFYKT